MQTKAVIFDFDGTLTKSRKGSNCWYEIWKEIDDLETDDKYYSMYKRNEITDDEWLILILDRFIEKKVNVKTCKNVAKRIKLMPGISEVFKTFKENKIQVFVLSGGVKQVIEQAIGGFSNYIESIEAYDFVFDKNDIIVDIARPDHNLEDKSDFVNFVKEKYNLEDEEILFVGNDKNDETVYKSGVKTLCINPDNTDSKDRKIWSYSIENCLDLREVLEYCILSKSKERKK